MPVALALSALASPARGQTPDPPAAEVSVRFVALDKQDVPVESLGPEDIKLEEGGRRQAVTSVKRLSGLPLSLVVALDTSASQERVIGGTVLAADALVQSIMRPGVDEVGVVTFTGVSAVEQWPTGDASKVRGAVAGVKVVLPPGYVGRGVVVGNLPPPPYSPAGATAVWDAVSFASEKVLAHGRADARRALVLITDGVDTASRIKPAEAVRAALRAGAVVYAIGVGDEQGFDGVDEGSLRQLAERTGGRAFFPKKVKDLPAIFRQIQAELLSPYVATFAAPAAGQGGQPRKLKLEVVNPELRRRGVRLLHPETYSAP